MVLYRKHPGSAYDCWRADHPCARCRRIPITSKPHRPRFFTFRPDHGELHVPQGGGHPANPDRNLAPGGFTVCPGEKFPSEDYCDRTHLFCVVPRLPDQGDFASTSANQFGLVPVVPFLARI